MLFQKVLLGRAANMETIAKMMAEQSNREKMSRSMALDMIKCPKIRTFIEDENVVENLFTYGQANLKVFIPQSFESSKEVEDQVEKLYSYWKGSISIRVDVCDESMVEITFTVKPI